MLIFGFYPNVVRIRVRQDRNGAGELTLQGTLTSQQQYVIPIFQRYYTWDRREWHRVGLHGRLRRRLGDHAVAKILAQRAFRCSCCEIAI